MKDLPASRCSRCGHVACPPDRYCSAGCLGAEQATVSVSPEGTLYSVSTIHVPHAIFGAPYTVAYVDLDAGPRLFGHLVGPDAARIGDRVTAFAEEVVKDDETSVAVQRFVPVSTEEVAA